MEARAALLGAKTVSDGVASRVVERELAKAVVSEVAWRVWEMSLGMVKRLLLFNCFASR
jgi:hypothetical protein